MDPELIDLLQQTREQIDRLHRQERQLREIILAECQDGRLDGRGCYATVKTTARKQVDYKAIVSKLAPSHQLVAAHTKHVPITTIRISAVADEPLPILLYQGAK